jgi:hypothetical protein
MECGVCGKKSLIVFIFYSELSLAFRIKKGSRVYAMYPQTTSLYSATVIDSTTYCREDDDIIVVEFDGEEPGMFSVACVCADVQHEG